MVVGRLTRNAASAMSDITRIFSQIDAGDPAAAEQLLPLVYDELRNLAAAKLAQEKPGQTLQATALVHEAYLRLVGERSFADRQHFFRVAAEAMRQILIDRARRQRRIRHGGEPLPEGPARSGSAEGRVQDGPVFGSSTVEIAGALPA